MEGGMICFNASSTAKNKNKKGGGGGWGGGTEAKRNCGALRALLEMRCSTSVHIKNKNEKMKKK